MESYTLFQLNEYVKRVIALNFKDSVWINAEISQVKLSRGNYYIDLIQKEENSETVKAKASAIIWFRKVAFLEKKFKSLFTSIIDTGNEIRIKVSVNFSERYGFSLVVEDLDASYTLGKAEMLKQEILIRLKNENLLFLNSELELPSVLQNIAVISSETAAGYKDFVSHVEANSYGYQYKIKLYPAAMQGVAVEREVISAINAIQADGAYDCIIIIRGGGAKLDLSAFDNYEIAKKIAKSPIPVITGIGHDIDSSITDAVSHTDLKTPTAAADFLIEWNLHFESKLLDLGLKIQLAYKDVVQINIRKLDLFNEKVRTAFERIKLSELQRLDGVNMRLKHTIGLKLTEQKELLKGMEIQIELLSPENTMKRGYSILRQDGKVITKKSEIDRKKPIVTELLDGKLTSKINE